MKMVKSILIMFMLFVVVLAHAGDSAPFVLDTREAPVLSEAKLAYDSSWVGGDSSAIVVIKANGNEINRMSGVGEFTSELLCGNHRLEYLTYVQGILQEESYVSEVNIAHVEVETRPAKAATCTEDGWTCEVKCSRCNVVVSTSKVVLKLGHSQQTTVTPIAPTCTEDGRTAEIICDRCNEKLQTSEVLSSHGGHSGAITKHAVAATSGTPGATAEMTCTRCGEILQEQEEIPALGYIRNVTARQLWPHKKLEITYELAEDIADVLTEDTELAVRIGDKVAERPEPQFVNDTTYPWTTDTGYRSDTVSYKSGNKGKASTMSARSVTVSGVSKVSFYWKVSSESNYDKLHFYVDGSDAVTAISGSVEWTNVEVYLDGNTSHTLKWSYEKDSIVDNGSDCGWVDCVEFMYADSSVIAQTFLGEMSLTPGLHRVVWDIEADGVEMEDASAVAEVSFGKNIPGFVTKTFPLAFDKTSDVWSDTPQMVESPSVVYATSLNEHTTVAYGCYMYMECGVTYYFKGRYDDYVGVKVGSNWIMSNSTVCNEASGSYTPSATGYYPVEFRVGNYTGRGGCYDSTVSHYGIKWRTSKNTTWRNIGNTSSETVFFASITESGSQDVCGVSSEFEVDAKSLRDGMAVEGALSLGYSPFADGAASVEIDGTKVFSSTNSGVFVWQPQTAGTHTLKHISGDYEWTRTVNVTGLAFEPAPTPNPPTEVDANVKINSTNKSFSQAGGSGAITTSGSGTLAVTASAEWITISSASSAGRPVAYKVAENKGVESRTGYIYISGYVFTVTQAGVGGDLDAYSAEFETDGGSGAFGVVVDAGVTWKVQSNVDWISVDPTTGTGESEIAFVVAPWDEVSTRVGTIAAAGKTFTVNQTGRRMKLSVNTVETDYLSHVLDIQIDALSATLWDIDLGASWVSVVDGGRGKGSDDVFIAIAENPSYAPRQGVVRIGTEHLLVTQAGRPTAALAFSISPEETTAAVDGANAILAVAATPDLPWSAKSEANWLTIMPSFQTGAGNGNVIYTASPNSSMEARTGQITVSPAAETGLAALTHTVTQPAARALISANEHIFDAAGSSFDVAVTVADVVNWSIVRGSESWITIAGSLSRIGPDTVMIAVQENLTTEAREATVTIAGHAFTVYQPGRRVNVEYEAKVFGTADDYGTLEVQPDGNVTWKAVVSEDALEWLVIWGENCDYDDDGNLVGVGEQTIEYIVTEYNGDGLPRTGTITIGDKVIYVTQRAYELNIEPSAVWVSGNAGAGSVSVPASIGEVWNAIATEPWITVVSGTDSGTGSGTVRYTFTENNTGKERTGRVIIAGEEYTITQAARQMVAIDVTTAVVTGSGEPGIGSGGTVSGAGVYERGAEVTLTAAPNDGYTFVGWTVAGTSAGNVNEMKFVADVDKEVVATFKQLSVYLVNGEAVREGVSRSFTAPDPIVDELGTTKLVCKGTSRFPEKGTAFSLVVTEDISFAWDLWETNYFVSVGQPNGGVIREGGVTSSGRWARQGEELMLTAHPNSGQSLFRWILSSADDAIGMSTSASLSLSVGKPMTISAVFGVFNDSIATAIDAPALEFATGGDAEWFPVVDATAQTGYMSVQSGAIAKESETWLETTLYGGGMLSFRWKVDCEKDDGGEVTWDRLSVFVNGVEAARIDGKSGWRGLTLPIDGEKTVVRWSFYRDDYDEPNGDCQNKAWVDGVQFTAKEGN